MENARLRFIAKGLLLSAVYCAAYLLAWFQSLDQWFLPAAVRMACLLFLSFRYWPFVLAGDIAAVLYVRAPKAGQYGELWAYLSPFLLAPSISIAPLILRRRLAKLLDNLLLFPFLVIAIAIWSSFCKLMINFLLDGPAADSVLDTFLRFTIGDCMGILIAVPSVMVWMRRKEWLLSSRRILIDVTVSIVLLSLTCKAVTSPEISPSLRQLFLVLMIVPAAALTILHGWKGAALGTALVNVFIGLALPEYDVIGAFDQNSFVAQQVLVVVTMAILCFGAMISSLYEKSRMLGISEEHALSLAQTSFLSSERNLRDRVLYMAQMQIGFDEYRKKLVERLKAHGHFDAAMDLNAEGVEQMEWFERHAAALYPIQIETQGLFAALHSQAFSRLWAADAELMLLVKGQPKALSLDLQIAAYRCICNAFALLSDTAPDYYQIRARAWQSQNRRGISVIVTARATTDATPGETALLAAMELEGRVRAYGGSLKRRHRHRIVISLAEYARVGYAKQSKIDPIAH